MNTDINTATAGSKQRFSLKGFFTKLKNLGKNQDPTLPPDKQSHVTLIEYISIIIARTGLILTSTTLGSYASTFLYGCYYGQVGMDATEAGKWIAILAAITTALAFGVSAVVSLVSYKFRSKLGRYRHWYLFGAIPAAILVVLQFVVPDTAFGKTGYIIFKFIITILITIIIAGASGTEGLFTVGGNIVQVISPNQQEKKKVVTIQQLAYYLGYGGAYGGAFIFGLFFGDKKEMYLSLAIFAAVLMCVGCLMMGIFCKERIEPPKKEKKKIGKAAISFFKYKNYLSYHISRWATMFSMTGTMIMYLAAIVVGANNAAAFAIPSAIGTGVGVLLCTILLKKVRCTSLLKFVGFYTMVAGVLCFLTVYFGGFNWGYYITYFLFGMNFGLAELSESHWLVEINDFLEWKTGERQEAIQGVIPGWITSGLCWIRSGVLIPLVILPLIGYNTALEGDSLLEYMKAQPNYDSTCVWLLAFALFGISLMRLITALSIILLYRMPPDEQKKMYEELNVIRQKINMENKGEVVLEAAIEATEETTETEIQE